MMPNPERYEISKAELVFTPGEDPCLEVEYWIGKIPHKMNHIISNELAIQINQYPLEYIYRIMNTLVNSGGNKAILITWGWEIEY